MAATDTFQNTVERLTPGERTSLADIIARTRAQMQTARSEDARLRVLEMFQRETYERLQAR